MNGDGDTNVLNRKMSYGGGFEIQATNIECQSVPRRSVRLCILLLFWQRIYKKSVLLPLFLYYHLAYKFLLFRTLFNLPVRRSRSMHWNNN